MTRKSEKFQKYVEDNLSQVFIETTRKDVPLVSLPLSPYLQLLSVSREGEDGILGAVLAAVIMSLNHEFKFFSVNEKQVSRVSILDFRIVNPKLLRELVRLSSGNLIFRI